ncbi:YdcF family protein [Nocardia thailandica]|uniref:YdcF family protein n=1 Tax=Nocardia thailandica TaxID=257275 RepID=A0ABW6PRX7_9NOCA
MAWSSPSSPSRVAVTAVVAGVTALLLWGEYASWRASRRLTGAAEGPDEVVVVLGFRNQAPRANLVNRGRVRAGLRSRDPGARTSRLIFTGGAVAGEVSEAELMAGYARRLGYTGLVETETESRSTWENIANVEPLLESADRIKIVSDAPHAARARRYLLRRRPDLAARLVRGEDYRFGESMPLKPVVALLDAWKHRRES